MQQADLWIRAKSAEHAHALAIKLRRETFADDPRVISAIAEIYGDDCWVWTCTQVPYDAVEEVEKLAAEMAKVAPDCEMLRATEANMDPYEAEPIKLPS